MNKEDVTPDMDYYFNGLNMIFSRIDDDAAIENNSYMALQKEISRLGAPVIANEENPLKRAIYVNIMTYLHMYFNKLASRKHEIEFLESSRQAWVGPLFVREMVEQGYDEQNFFFYALKGLIRNGAKSAYILIYDKPIKYEKTDNWTVPDKLYLAAYYNGVVRESYEPDKRPVITVKDGIGDIVTGTNRRVVTYSLFDQDNQYGILMCECDESGIFTAYITSLQLSISIHFLEINKYKHEVEASLNDALSELEKKNQVLEFVSNSDPLTGLMNRRGLVEQALDRIKLNEGKRGYAIFADLDHLKQINDTFGHAEGDKAITAIADLLKENSSEDALIARIGGDEYLILDFDEDKLTSNPVDVIKNAYYELNKNSDLPYYIEASLGMTEFICRSGMKISDLLNMSDEVMYEAKKFRRSSVIK